MKLSFTLSLCFFLLFKFAVSQNYQPFAPSTTYTFESFRPKWTPSNPNHVFKSYHILKTDTAVIVGQDTVYEFNRIARDTIREIASWYVDHLKLDQDNIFGKAMIAKAGNTYEFVSSDLDTFRIQPYAPLNQPWIFQTSSGISAQISSRTEQNFLGLRDSVIQILLSNQDTILLSENYGLLEAKPFLPMSIDNSWADMGGDYGANFEIVSKQSLWGIEELNIGGKLPQFADLFSLQSGDSLVYEARGDFFRGSVCIFDWWEIIGETVFPNPDSAVFSVRVEDVFTNCGDRISYDGVDTFNIGHHARDFYPKLLTQQVNDHNIVLRGPFVADGLNGRMYYIIQEYLSVDSTTEELQFSLYGINEGAYAEGLGLIASRFYWGEQEGGGPALLNNRLLCYKKDQDSAGVCLNPNVYLSLDPILEAANLKAYPNPASTQIRIDWDFLPAGLLDIELLDQSGRVMYSQSISTPRQNQTNLDVSAYANGMYFLRFVYEGRKSGALKVLIHK